MCHLPSYQRGGVPAILNINKNRKLENIFPSLQFPSLLLHFHLPDGGCALSKPHLCWDNLLEYPDFPSLICLKVVRWPISTVAHKGHETPAIYFGKFEW